MRDVFKALAITAAIAGGFSAFVGIQYLIGVTFGPIGWVIVNVLLVVFMAVYAMIKEDAAEAEHEARLEKLRTRR